MEEKNATNDSTLLDSLRAIDENAYEASPLQKFIRSKGIYITMTTTALGLFVGIPLLFWFTSVTVISLSSIMLLIFACGVLGLIQWKYVRDYLDMEYRHFAMYAFSGFGMCFINLILLLNYVIPVKTYTQTYDIAIARHNNAFEVNLKDNDNIALERSLNIYFNEHYRFTPSSKNISVTFDKGVFGFDSIRDCKFN